MIKLFKDRLEKNKDKLERKLEKYYDANKILDYSDLFKVICLSLDIGIITDGIKEIDFEDHFLVIASYGFDYNSHLMTYVNCCNDDLEINKLEDIFIKEKEGQDIYKNLLELAMEMIENTINPYDNTGDFSKAEE